MIHVLRGQAASPAMLNVFGVRSASVSVQGIARNSKDDSTGTSIDGRILLVADGIGRDAGGEIASAMAIETARNQLETTLSRQSTGELVGDPSLLINAAMAQANQAVLDLAHKPKHSGTSSTLVVGVFDGPRIHVQSAGDSRAYLIRGTIIEQLTVDDSFTQMMLSCGLVSREDARTHPRRGVLLRALGQHDFVPNPDVVTRELESGDRILLCTDGLSDFVEDEDMRAIVCESGSPAEAVHRLTAAAQKAESQEDVSCIVAFVD